MTPAEEVIWGLDRAHLTVATAESCTGGLLSALLTSVSGASAVFSGGFVTYTKDAKSALLGIDRDFLDAVGAVHPEVARQMAESARKRLKTDLALSVTGLAGPTGDGSMAKVGDVYIGFAAPEGTRVLELHQDIGRDALRNLACETALGEVCRYLREKFTRS